MVHVKPLSVKLGNMKLKVCGMRDVHNLEELLTIQPDYIGFIFFEKSKRNVVHFPSVSIPESIKKVGVFVNESPEHICELVQKNDLNAVQLHGDESPTYCKELAHLLKGIEISKAFSIDDSFNFQQTLAYEPSCKFFVFDTKGKERGGNGVKFNWEVLSNYDGTTPFLLSGGIGLEDVEALEKFSQTIAAKHCLGVDINSGFEIEPGLKNIEEIKQFKAKLP